MYLHVYEFQYIRTTFQKFGGSKVKSTKTTKQSHLNLFVLIYDDMIDLTYNTIKLD